MLQPEFIRLLSGDFLNSRIDTIPTLPIDSNPMESIRTLAHGGGDSATEGDSSPFTFTPQLIQLNKDHEFFEDGDIHRHMYLQNFSTNTAEDSPKLSVSEFGCHISGCRQVFSSVEEYEHHYNSLHRHVCCSCQRSLPSARLLDIHIQEWHDSLFTILAQRQDMYQCLVEGCGLKFRTRLQRKDHLIKVHKYPPDFRFDKYKKRRRARETKGPQLKDTSMEVTEVVCESVGVCEALSAHSMEGESMEVHLPQEPETLKPAANTANSVPIAMNTEHPAANSAPPHTNTDQLRPRFSYRVPQSVCFGQGSVRGFRGQGRRK